MHSYGLQDEFRVKGKISLTTQQRFSLGHGSQVDWDLKEKRKDKFLSGGLKNNNKSYLNYMLK